MKHKKTENQKEYEAHVDQLINYVKTHKDDLATQRIVAKVLNDKQIGLTEGDLNEFKAQVGRLDKGELQNLLGMMGIPEYTLDTNVTSRNETKFPH